jgi:uncharacterized protein (UPF0333 family)
MENTQKGFVSLIGMLVILVVVGIVAYNYLSRNELTGTSRYEENRAAIDAAEEAKRMIEAR